MSEFNKNEEMEKDLEINEESSYEAQDYEPACDAEEETGLSTGLVVALTSLATAGAIWLGSKVCKFAKGRKAKKASEAAQAQSEPESDSQPESEPASENAEA